MKKKAKEKSISFDKLKLVGRPEKDRRVRQADRLGRLMRILERLLSRGRWDIKAIAADLEVSERTVHRDLEALELAGVPWYHDADARCYRLRPDYRFPTLNLTDDELLGQATAASLTQAEGLNINSGAKAINRKIAANNEQAGRLLDEAQKLIGVLDLQLANHREHLDIIRTMQWALVHKKVLTGTYRTPYQAKPVNLTLHPYRLVLLKACWYLIARPDDREAPRTYRVARFQKLKMLDRPAQVPEEFDLRAYFGKAWAVYRGDQTYEIELKFLPEAADMVTETIWHSTQKVTKHTDGSVTLKFSVDGLSEILNWIVGWTKWVQVVAPAELRDLVIEQHRQALEQYEPKKS
jgi:predicted DNA-binding transcriptional regulator YafY